MNYKVEDKEFSDDISFIISKSQIEPDEYYEILRHNYFGISELSVLEKQEKEISKLKAINLYRSFSEKEFSKNNISTMSSIQDIHLFILGDI